MQEEEDLVQGGKSQLWQEGKETKARIEGLLGQEQRKENIGETGGKVRILSLFLWAA